MYRKQISRPFRSLSVALVAEHNSRLAIIGKTGVGKSSVARLLAADFGFGIISTGAVCRNVCRLLFGNEEKSNTQRLDDVLTKLDPSIFLNAALRDTDLSARTVVDSARFETDLELLKGLGFSVLRVTATVDARRDRLAMRSQAFDFDAQGSHRSETELDGVISDLEIDNSGDIEMLRRQLKLIL